MSLGQQQCEREIFSGTNALETSCIVLLASLNCQSILCFARPFGGTTSAVDDKRRVTDVLG